MPVLDRIMSTSPRQIPLVQPPVYPLFVLEGCDGYWDMQDGGRPGASLRRAIDHSGMNNHLVGQGPVSQAGPGGLLASFDGVDDYLENSTPNMPISPTFSWDAWVYSIDVTPRRYIINRGQYTGWECRVENSKLSFLVRDGAMAVVVSMTANAVLQTGRWYHLAGTSRAGRLECYVNGAYDSGVNNVGYTTPGPGTNLRISYSASTCKGFIGKVALYSRTLSPQEIVEIYRSEAPRFGLPG